ncbi:uncharacterized protein [Montipora foliosa]|uniref:uncharacterized protein n=1 Tax=Montipora foliosa TaxID=591990 RepID=UPI0035F18D17
MRDQSLLTKATQHKPWIIHFNCRSLLHHIDELRLIFTGNHPLLIAISESWLNDTVVNSDVSISGYQIFRLDRSHGRRGGGVAVYLLNQNGLKFSRRYDLERMRSYEALWLQVEINRKKYLFCCAYRAPDESLGIFGYLEDILHKATRENFEVIILGDLNCDCLKSELKQTERMYEFLMANELTQMIAEPTRVTSTSSSLSDVLITSTPNSFERTGVLSTSFSDHLPIYGVLCGSSVKPVKHRYIETRSFSRQSMERFNADLELVPWHVVEIFSDIDDKYYVWHTLFLAIFNEHFPIRRKRIRQSTHPWLDNSILSTMRRRDQFYRKARKFNRPSDWSEYRRLRNLINSSLRKAKKSYFADKLEESRPNPSEFWKTLKQVLPNKNAISIDILLTIKK